ncbi:AraC family transcriptional regulator [Duganella sp. sic0402]|uniref:AraC family transcriptional regulator n=1 Tax=Duganella sp. sic0402 TaxID=2854786 RepID=UPI001C488385|nr:AraC family transcriptional regulator [Duganella sp. sic0402]MBV7539168.1 AraC family transcriptional regulator [Duganella sp. sic0402]
MHQLLSFRDAIARHAPEDGTFACAIPGLKLIRCSAPTMPMPVVYEPTACFVAQGRKRATLGASVFHYDPSSYLVASVGLPVMGAVIEASEAHPYMSIQLDLDAAELAELALKTPQPPQNVTAAGLTLNQMNSGLLDAATRLVALLDTPDDIGALAPLAVREILYRLLTGPNGGAIQAITQADSRQSQIARVIVWIRSHFKDGWRIEDLAGIAGMSRSAFHVHFKAMTAMSPLEFRTQLRMQEARRLMVSDGLDAANAGYHVGYDSPSQFSRDYSRLFGAPPAKDASRLRFAG